MVGLVLATSGLEHTGLPQAALRLSAGQVYNSTLTFFLLFRPEILNFSGIGRKVRVELLPTKVEKSNSLQFDPDFWVKRSQGRLSGKRICYFSVKEFVTFWTRTNCGFYKWSLCSLKPKNTLRPPQPPKSSSREETEILPLRLTPSAPRHFPYIS